MNGHKNWGLGSWGAALLLALTLRGVWMLCVRPEPIADYAFYFTRAIELGQGLGYRYQGHPTAFYPVGTSLLLAGPLKWFGPTLEVALVLSLVAWGISVVMTYKLAELLSDARVAKVAALLVAIHPDFIAFSSLVASENFFIPLMLASLYLLCRSVLSVQPRWGSVATAGALFGAALLVRSTGLILLPVLSLLLVWAGRRRWLAGVAQGALFAASVLLVLSPWVVRNATELGKPVLTTNGGISLWWGNNPHASGGFPLAIAPPTQDLSTVEAELANNARFSRAAFHFMLEHTGHWISLIPSKFAYLFGAVSPDVGFSLRYRYMAGVWAIEGHPRLGDPSRAPEAEYVLRPLDGVESRMVGLYYRVSGGDLGLLWQQLPWVLGSVGFAVMLVRQAKRRVAVLTVALIPLAWVAFHITLGNGQSRYLLSVAPLLIVGSSYLVVWLMDHWRQSRSPTIASRG